MMMPAPIVGSCRETAQNISDYLERKMSFFKWMRIRLHLSICPMCRKWLQELQATFQCIEGARSAEGLLQAPPELRRRIEHIFQT